MGAIKVPEGKKVYINGDGSPIVGVDLVLDEPITLNLASNWEPLMNKTAGAAKFLSVLGNVFSDATEGRVAFSGQSPIFGYQIFTSGEPLSFNFTVTLYADKTNVNAKDQVLIPALVLAALPLPTRSKDGLLLEPPGPSILSLIKGLNIIGNLFNTGEASLAQKVKDQIDNLAGKIFSISIGKFLYLPMVIVPKAEPTFALETDEDGYPMWAKVNIDVKSVEIAHRQMLLRGQ